MEHLSPGTPAATLRETVSHWTKFIDRCITKRLETERFTEFVRLVYEKHPLPPATVASLFLRPQPSNSDSLDPRIPSYLQVLSQLGYINTPSILGALYRYSSSHAQARVPGEGGGDGRGGGDGAGDGDKATKDPVYWRSSYWAEEVLFYKLTKSVVEGRAVPDTSTALEVAKIMSKWMSLFAAASGVFAADGMGDGPMATGSQVQEEMESARAAFVALLMRLCDDGVFTAAVVKSMAKKVRRDLSQSLASFVPTLQLVPQVTDKLERFRTEELARADPEDEKKQAADAAMNEMLSSAVGLEHFEVSQVEIINTRVGLYVYLNALLVGRPIFEDHDFFTYLNNRYHGDAQSGAIQLILASFDILANAVFRNSGKEDAHLLRSFLVNKVPLLLRVICQSQFSAVSAEVCVTEALKTVDASLFPTASAMFDESKSSNPYTESVREEFCAACVSQGLVDKARLDSILGEISMGYEPKKYVKNELVRKCLSDSDKLQGLVRDLEKMDGNVSVVSEAIVELIKQMCNSKDTTSLKLLCAQLVQRPHSLDILLLFQRLPDIVEPLCHLLDKWKYDDDQNEYQPVYEEFGAILLLVLGFAYRYDLNPLDMGIYSSSSSVGKIIAWGHVHRELEDLTDKENEHLGGWIRGLFDAEVGSLSDELMSSYPPQEFYLLVSSLFQNIVTGYANGYLTDEVLKGGVEYLVDTFLLPSLVPGIRFLADHLWIDGKEQKAVIKVLQLILLPSQISGEASLMHTSVKYIIAKPLEHALRSYQKRDPQNQDINPLLNAIKDNVPMSRRTGDAEMNEIEGWCSTQPSGFMSAIKNTIQVLVQWGMHNSLNTMPTTYTHRQLNVAINMCGARKVLNTILEEVKSQSEVGNASFVYEVAVALICAPNVTTEPPPPPPATDGEGNVQAPLPPAQLPLTLREVLRIDAEDCLKIQKTDAVLAEHVVRLHRRVEAQLSLPQIQTPQTNLLQANMSLGLDANAGAAAAVAVAAGLGDVMVGAGDLDMSGMRDLGGAGAGSAGGDDLFSGFGADLDANFDWDSMDMS